MIPPLAHVEMGSDWDGPGCMTHMQAFLISFKPAALWDQFGPWTNPAIKDFSFSFFLPLNPAIWYWFSRFDLYARNFLNNCDTVVLIVKHWGQSASRSLWFFQGKSDLKKKLQRLVAIDSVAGNFLFFFS